MPRELIKIGDSTYRVEDEYVRAYILLGEEKVAVIDTGIFGPGVKALAKELSDKEIILINTHGDRDHVSGNGDFAEYYISKADYEGCQLVEICPNATPIFLQDGQLIELGGRTLEVITIPGHTYGSIALLDKQNRTLIAGDSVQSGNIFMFGPHRDIHSFKSSLKKLIARSKEYDRIYASHDAFELDKEYPEKVLYSFEEYEKGELTPVDMELHGQMVKCYKGKYCGFFIAD